MANDFDLLYKKLQSDIKKFSVAFKINKHIEVSPLPNTNTYYKDKAPPPTERKLLHIHAYVVATHALFELFFEKVGLLLMSKSKEYYEQDRKINTFLKNLISKKTKATEIDKQFLKNVIVDAVNEFVNHIDNNFEMSLKKLIDALDDSFQDYVGGDKGINSAQGMYDLLCEIAISKTPNEILLVRFASFAKERGDFAHKGIIKSTLSPATIQTWIDDILYIAKDVTEQAKTLITTII